MSPLGAGELTHANACQDHGANGQFGLRADFSSRSYQGFRFIQVEVAADPGGFDLRPLKCVERIRRNSPAPLAILQERP